MNVEDGGRGIETHMGKGRVMAEMGLGSRGE